MLSPAWVFPTPPRSPWCLPFLTVLLGNFSELHTGGWPLSFGCRLPLAYGCGRRIGWLEAPRIGDGESGGCFSNVLFVFGPLGFFMFLFFLGTLWLFIGVVGPMFGCKCIACLFEINSLP